MGFFLGFFSHRLKRNSFEAWWQCRGSKGLKFSCPLGSGGEGCKNTHRPHSWAECSTLNSGRRVIAAEGWGGGDGDSGIPRRITWSEQGIYTTLSLDGPLATTAAAENVKTSQVAEPEPCGPPPMWWGHVCLDNNTNSIYYTWTFSHKHIQDL